MHFCFDLWEKQLIWLYSALTNHRRLTETRDSACHLFSQNFIKKSFTFWTILLTSALRVTLTQGFAELFLIEREHRGCCRAEKVRAASLSFSSTTVGLLLEGERKPIRSFQKPAVSLASRIWRMVVGWILQNNVFRTFDLRPTYV